jgi:hypothetical protein
MTKELFGEIDAVAVREAPPDPEVLKAVGLNHDLASAIADLVDNSVDASARHINVRFVLLDGLIRELLVIDDGVGMNAEAIDSAMRLGRQKSSAPGTLGHFGMGLKAATFSQADLLTVMSHMSAEEPVGRRMAREQTSNRFDVEELSGTHVDEQLDSRWLVAMRTSGTVVVWDQIRTFPKAKDRAVTNSFVEKSVARLRKHLGLVFHRLLAADKFSIEIDVLDLDLEDLGLPFEVDPINPFGYIRSGQPQYPKTLRASSDKAAVDMRCHIWPPGSDSHLFRLDERSAEREQGFYLYRNDRLLAHGGWANVTQDHKRRKLARVEIDIDDHSGLFSMSVEKSGVQFSADLVHAIEAAVAEDGTTFDEYLQVAEAVFMDSNRKTTKRQPMLPPGKGISPRVKRALDREVELLDGEEPIQIKWATFDTDDFCDVDRANRTLWLNSRFRPYVLKGNRGGLNDAPLVKALLYLLFEDVFHGTFYGPKDKDNVSLWQSVLRAAALAEADDGD